MRAEFLSPRPSSPVRLRARRAPALAFAALTLAALPASAEDAAVPPNPVEFGGSFFTRFETRQGYGSPDVKNQDFFRFRARAELRSAAFDIGGGWTVRVRFAPQAAGLMHVGGDDLLDAALGLHEGVVDFASAAAILSVGRFEMVYGDHLVVGNVDWHPTGRAFDGIRARILAGQGAWVDLFVTFLSEGFSETPPLGEDFGAGDLAFAGVYASVGPLLAQGLAFDVYGLFRGSPGVDEGGQTRPDLLEATLGARAKGRAAFFDYRVEAGVQLGERAGKDVLAYQADAELGFNALEGDMIRFAVEGLLASGDDPTTAGKDEGWFHLYPTAHKWLGLMDVIGARTNVAAAVGHLQIKPGAGVALSASGHGFFRLEDTAATKSGYAGAELDCGVAYKPHPIVLLRGGYGMFIPDGAGASDLLHFAEAEVRVTLP